MSKDVFHLDETIVVLVEMQESLSNWNIGHREF